MCTAVRLKVAKSWAWCSATLSYCGEFFENIQLDQLDQRNNSPSLFYKSFKKKGHLFSFCKNFEPVQLFKVNTSMSYERSRILKDPSGGQQLQQQLQGTNCNKNFYKKS